MVLPGIWLLIGLRRRCCSPAYASEGGRFLISRRGALRGQSGGDLLRRARSDGKLEVSTIGLRCIMVFLAIQRTGSARVGCEYSDLVLDGAHFRRWDGVSIRGRIRRRCIIVMMAMRAAVWQNGASHFLNSILHAMRRSGIERGGRSLKRRQVIRDMVMIAAR